MPPIELVDRPHRVVLWEFAGKYDSHGQPKVTDTPIEVFVRWNDTRSERLMPDGTTITIDSQLVVDRKVPEFSIFWRGALADLPATFTEDDGPLMQVKYYNGVDDTKGRSTRHEVQCMRYKGTLPNLVH